MSYLSQHGPLLLRNGFNIVPIGKGTKFPPIDDWQKIRASTKHVSQWIKSGYPGVGVLTEHTPAIDIDILERDVTLKVINKCWEWFGESPIRIGKAPKALLVFRTDEPFGKLRSKKYIDNKGNTHQLEILGRGNQFVAYAKHPDTKHPYFYMDQDAQTLDDSESLSAWNVKDLPRVTKEDALKFIQWFETECVLEDWTVKSGLNGTSKKQIGVSGEKGGASAFENAVPPLNISNTQVVRILEQLDPNLLDYDDWLNVGMGLYHQYEGEKIGVELWEAWESESSKYVKGYGKKKWKSFNADLNRGRAITFATVKKMRNIQRDNETWREDHQNEQLQLIAGLIDPFGLPEYHNGSADDGWLHRQQPDEDEVASSSKSKPEKPLDILDKFLRRYIYIEQGALVFDTKLNPHVAVSELTHFKNAKANVRKEVPMFNPPKSDPERTVIKQVAELWQQSPDRRTVRYEGYKPNGGLIYKEKGVRRVNTFFFPINNTRE